MKVYVDELPKDCIDCPCESEYYCNLLNEDVGCLEWGETHKNCPLQSLADYTKQVRKEVIEEIKENLLKLEPYCIEQPNLYDFNCQEIIDILDQIEQGEQHG